jgi:hypothetical protein
MQRERLTLARIAAFNCAPDKNQAFLWDTDAPRLAIRATAGAKSFIFESKLERQTIRRTIGDVKNWNLDDARSEARRLQTLIDKGIDPRDIDREKTTAKRAAIAVKEAEALAVENRKQYTLKALCNIYCDHLEAKGKTQSARQARSIIKVHVFEAYPDIAGLPAAEVNSDHAATLIRKVMEQGKGRTAGVLRSYLSAAFNAARKARFDAKLPSELIAYGVKDNPAEIIATIAVNRGDRTLVADELKNYMAALSDDDLSDLALKLALYAGGQRMAQLLRPRISDYDQETQTLRLWDSKGKRTTPREHLLPLATKGATIAEKLVERARKQEEANARKEGREPNYRNLWLFSSHGKAQLVDTTPGKRVAEISKAMKVEPFDLRDIRRTCETMLAGIRIHKDIRSQLLSHGLSGVQDAHYDRHGYIDEKRAALVAWERRLDEIAAGKKAANVVQMKRKKAS